MFDVGLSELMLIGVIVLVVLGPERLPKAARMAGALLRRLRGSWSHLRNELEREIAADELKRTLHATKDAMHKANPAPVVEAAVQDAIAVVNKPDSP